MSPDQLQIDLGSLASTVPLRSAKTDFAYGDPYELLALASSQLSALQSYCYNCNGRNVCDSRFKDAACSRFEPVSSSMSLLDAYGFSGTAQHNRISPKTGKVESINLLDSRRMKYCSVFASDDHNLSSYFHTYPSFLTVIKDAETSCETRRELPVDLARVQPRQFGKTVAPDRKYGVGRRSFTNPPTSAAAASACWSNVLQVHRPCAPQNLYQ